MTIQIFDTYTRTLQPFVPIDKKHVKMYVCGPTVYDFIHIGNARPLVVFDVLYRLLQRTYAQVSYVRNITDIDDKINAQALKNGEHIRELTDRTTAQFFADCKALRTRPPTVQPRATEYVEEMKAMIDTLLTKGHAYVSDGHVLFRVKSWAEYGKFARKEYDAQVAGARVEVASYKQDPADFVLWKPSNDTEPGWDSPWGYGRPGWHIECSAMAKKNLGEHFDIHGGGLDLIFPHHQNEIAQSCCANDSGTFAKYWMHNGFVMSEGEKMSKSLGNFYTVRELLQEYRGSAIRLVLLGTHYRKPLDFTKAKLDEAKHSLRKLTNTLYGENQCVKNDTEIQKDHFKEKFIGAIKQDLNTPLALSVLWEYQKITNSNPSKQNKNILREAVKFLGFDLSKEYNFHAKKNSAIEIDNHSEIKLLAENRKTAKHNKDFVTADAIRAQIESMGYTITDLPSGDYQIVKK